MVRRHVLLLRSFEILKDRLINHRHIRKRRQQCTASLGLLLPVNALDHLGKRIFRAQASGIEQILGIKVNGDGFCNHACIIHNLTC